ncbi:MAG: hypothetical protein C5B50_19900 [Verrucomicrobia bacterium]|nr:MAG: hypothetical protein C5B50_19900 [Verrucomicrobiota bacterium]
MKSKLITCVILAINALLLQGCIAFPPLVQVEHKDSPNNNNAEIVKRLDTIDHRLEKLEQTSAQK